MLNITNYVGNANQTVICHLIPIRMATIQKKKTKTQKITRVGEEVEKLEPLCTFVGM